MKTKSTVLILSLVLLITAALSQLFAFNAQATSGDASILSGVWRGQREAQPTGLPFVTLTLANENGNLTGAILLWVIHLEQGKPVASEPGVPEPILNPTFDGRTLTFQTKYRGHLPKGISSDNPLLTYHLKLIPPDKAELVRADMVTDAQSITGSPIPLGPPLLMQKSAN